MPKVSTERKQFYKAKIRSLLAVDHQMSNREIEEQLAQNGIVISEDFIAKLRKKVEQEKALRTDRMTLNHAIATVSDTMSETNRLAWQIALSPKSEPRDKIAALRKIEKAHVDMFNILFDAGIFERKLGTLEHEIRNAPLSDEQKEAIRVAFARWGLIAPQQKNNEPNIAAA